MKREDQDRFSSEGTEGMLDVIFGCTLIFLLLSCLVQVGKGESQEMTLPSINLSKTRKQLNSGDDAVKKTVISLRLEDSKPVLYVNNHAVGLDQLAGELKNMSGVGNVALRRDRDLPCGFEDQVIVKCQQAGINRVAIVVGIGKENKK